MTTHIHYNLNEFPTTHKMSSAQLILFWFATVGESIFNLLFAEPLCEPKITQLQGQDGETFWEIYDPMTEKTVYCMSDCEVMEWIDSHHR